MGTRALVHIKSIGKDSKTLVTLYRQYDGYVSELGDDIYSLLNKGDVRIVCGYDQNDRHPEAFNGMGDLAAYMVKNLKEGIGNVYINEPDSISCGEEYVYILYLVQNELMLKVIDVYSDEVYLGKLSMFPTLLEKWNQDCEA